jgi:hypothetical protein
MNLNTFSLRGYRVLYTLYAWFLFPVPPPCWKKLSIFLGFRKRNLVKGNLFCYIKVHTILEE